MMYNVGIIRSMCPMFHHQSSEVVISIRKRGYHNDLVLGGLKEELVWLFKGEVFNGCTNLLVDISLSVVGSLVDLVSKGVLCGGGAGSEGSVSVLGNRLKMLLVTCICLRWRL